MSDEPKPRKSRVLTRGRPFPPGNPGRPRGSRNKSTVMLEKLFKGEAEEVGRKAVELAKRGRLDAIKLVLDRACPPRQGRPVEGLSLPPMTSMEDAVAATGAIAAAVAEGLLTIPEARDLAEIIDVFRRAQELADIERRVVVLEQEAAKSTQKGSGHAPHQAG